MKAKANYLTFMMFLAVAVVSAQKQTKEFKETFSVNKDVTVNVNTINTDVEFDTWNQNKVEVTATIEIEGLSKEEAQEYFNSWEFEALGNSSKVEISAVGMKHSVVDVQSIDFLSPTNDLVVIGSPFVEEIEIDSLCILPPLPHAIIELGEVDFDYEAFDKEGEAYLKKWKQEWDQNFNKLYSKAAIEEKMEEWKAKVEKQKARRIVLMEKRKEAVSKKREELQKELENRKEELIEKRTKLELKRAELIEKKVEKVIVTNYPRIENKLVNGFNYDFFTGNGSSEITIHKDGKVITLKIKKKIKVKLPKGAKLHLNVRHGEVKLAENTTNIKATLNYSRLLANTINGNKTYIESSYAPVEVGQWNDGKLILNFSNKADIKSAGDIHLIASSSNVIIDKLTKKAVIDANLGSIKVTEINPAFSSLILNMDNMEGSFKFPNTPYKLFIKDEHGSLKFPKNWKLTKLDKVTKQGYNINSNTSKTVTLNSFFSNLVFL
ncbi:hypothetical protein NBRC110019_10540 [Neptunitalea chrysea]|uniref:Adhesin domain-containing protein n=2 Tax=Neptunitalea chrysea TaxID=1647581 RepID=A0A9W6B3Z4_9FLAO|nr:hypothetical protein NBRC110019_10540 [Neptunitalea chrysea]